MNKKEAAELHNYNRWLRINARPKAEPIKRGNKSLLMFSAIAATTVLHQDAYGERRRRRSI